MDFNTIVQAISSIGFPIVMCGVACWYIKYSDDRHKEETDKLTEAVHNNTIVITRLIEKLEKEESKSA